MSQSLDDIFPRGTVVSYEPHYLNELGEPVQEIGVVSSCNDMFVFVKFKRQLDKFDWDGVTAQGCKPSQLKIIIQKGETHEVMAPKQEG